MATLEEINIGQAANDRKGDPLRNAMQKVNTNFSRLNLELKGVWDSKGAVNGFAPLDANGRLPMAHAPYSLRLPATSHDLNAYVTPGTWFQASNSGAAAGANYPVNVAGWLEVVPDYQPASSAVMQRYTTRATASTATRVFVRTQTGTAGTWLDWTEIPNFAGVFGFMGVMPGAQNLNDYTQRGIWIVGSSNTASGGTNYPIGHSGVLLVLSGIHPGQAAGTTGIVQVYVAANSNRLFFRTLVVGTWSAWDEAVRTSLMGAASGVATLDANKKIPQDQIPGVLGKSLGVADNLNDFDTPGTYYMNNNATALPELNYPVVLAGMLMVETATGGNLQVTQLYVTNPASNPRMFLRIRFGTSKTWGPWFELARFDQAMTHTFLTAATDANTLTADNTWYSWVSATVWNENFPPHPIKVGGFIQTYWLSAANIVQIATLNAGGGSRNIVYQRQANGSTLTWTQWRLMSPLSTVGHLPVVNVGDAYVDGVGWHRWNAGLSGYVLAPAYPTQREGLGTEWASAASILVKPGRCASASGDVLLELTANNTRTIQTSGAFVHGSSGNGLLSGVRQAGWWYYVFLIRRDSDGSVCVAFDSSSTCANRPAGYTHYRRIGTVRTDVINGLVPFTQIGNEFWYDDPRIIYNGDTVIAGTTYQPVLGLPGISTTAHLQGWVTSAAAGQNPVINMARQVRGGGYSAYSLVMVANPNANHVNNWSIPAVFVPGTSPSVRITSSATGTVVLHLQGYTDHFED